ETGGQFALDVKIVLLQISVFLDCVAGGGKVVLGQDVLRDVRLRIASSDRDQRAGTSFVERSLSSPGKIGSATRRRQRTSVLIQRGTGSQAAIVARKKVRCSAADGVDVWVGSERNIVRNKENSEAATDHGFGSYSIRESQPWQDFFFRKRQVITAA